MPVTTSGSIFFQESHLTLWGLQQARPGAEALLAPWNQGRLPGASSTHKSESSPSWWKAGEADNRTGTLLAPARNSPGSATVLGRGVTSMTAGP